MDVYRCPICGSYSDFTIDHFIPKSRGGSNKKVNLHLICRSCNSLKNDKLVTYKELRWLRKWKK